MKVVRFFREVKSEVSKVTWPDMKTTRGMTMMVVVLVAFFSLYLWLVDIVLNGGVRLVTGF